MESFILRQQTPMLSNAYSTLILVHRLCLQGTASDSNTL